MISMGKKFDCRCFTLIEMVAVLAIAVLISAMSLLYMALGVGGTSAPTAENHSDELLEFIRSARME